jgi:hypothetical protein
MAPSADRRSRPGSHRAALRPQLTPDGSAQLQLRPRPAIHPDLATTATLGATHQGSIARCVKVGLGEIEVRVANRRWSFGSGSCDPVAVELARRLWVPDLPCRQNCRKPRVCWVWSSTGSIFSVGGGRAVAVRAGQDAAHELIEPAGSSHARLLFQAGVA